MAAACPGSHRLSWDFGPGFWWPHNGGRPGPAVLPRSRHAAPGVVVQWVVVALSLGRARTLLAPARPLPSQPSPLGYASDCRAPCAALSPPGLSGSGFPGWRSAVEGAPHAHGRGGRGPEAGGRAGRCLEAAPCSSGWRKPQQALCFPCRSLGSCPHRCSRTGCCCAAPPPCTVHTSLRYRHTAHCLRHCPSLALWFPDETS